MQNLTLFIPGLFLSQKDIAAVDTPDTPALQKLLSCARRELLKPFTFVDMLAGLFNIEKPAGRDFPAAAVTRLVDDDQAVDGFWMRADPVHLVADQARLVLMDDSAFTLNQHDALVLAADIREIFREQGLTLEAPTMYRWYLKLAKQPSLVTTPIHEVTGKDINRYMPAGDDSPFWIRLMNEVQMVLHDSAINRSREANHEYAVNSVWFWGAGQLPPSPVCSWSRLFTDEDTSRGLAKLAGIECSELPDMLEEVIERSSAGDHVLVVLSFGMRHRQYQDINGWQDFITYLEQFWFSGLEKRIRAGAVKQLTVLTEYQQFDLDKMSFLKFWRRNLPLPAYAN